MSQRQLHESEADMTTTDLFAVRPCGMEARGKPRYRTQVNPCAGWSGLGKCAGKHDALYPTVAGTVLGAAIAGHFSSLPQEISMSPSPLGDGRACGGNDARTMRMEKSDHPIVALKPGNAGGAKGVTS